MNKMTLAAVVAVGLMTSSVGLAYSQEANITNSETQLLASCPLSGCNTPVTPETAKCPKCHNEKPKCGCNSNVKNDDLEKYSACKNSNDPNGKKQVYAYPENIYGGNQIIGSDRNSITSGDIAQNHGVNVLRPNEGATTGAAASLPILDKTQGALNGVEVDRSLLDEDNCKATIETPTSMEVVEKSLESIDMSMTGGAAPIVSSFRDVPTGFWAGCDINKLAENNIIAGYPDRTFKPNLPVSRAEIASMVVKGFNLENTPASCSQIFKDVPKSFWGHKSISQAVEAGMMAGYSNNKFMPNEPVSRAEAMTILSKGITCPMDECKAQSILSQYCDGDKVPNWAKIPVAKALDSGVLKDTPQPNTIAPNKDASRAEIASMLESTRVALGYSTSDKVSMNNCGCNESKAYVEKEQVKTIPTLQLTFNDIINAKNARVGDQFAATTTDSVVIDGITYPAGSTVRGKVEEVVRPNKDQGGSLRFSFNTIQNCDNKSNLPQQILAAQVSCENKPNGFIRALEMPFTWTGALIGNAGRAVGGMLIGTTNAIEDITNNFGTGVGETFQGQFKAAGRSFQDSGKYLLKAPIDFTRTALSGTMGLFQVTGDEMAYLVDKNGDKISSINTKEKVTIAFGCK